MSLTSSLELIERINSSTIDYETYDFSALEEHYRDIEPVGYELLVRIFLPKAQEKTKGGILLTDSILDGEYAENRFTNNVGVIVKKGPGVYKDTVRYEHTGEYAQVEDWICFSRHAGVDTFEYDGWATCWLKEDQIRGKVKDPRKVKRLTR